MCHNASCPWISTRQQHTHNGVIQHHPNSIMPLAVLLAAPLLCVAAAAPRRVLSQGRTGLEHSPHSQMSLSCSASVLCACSVRSTLHCCMVRNQGCRLRQPSAALDMIALSQDATSSIVAVLSPSNPFRRCVSHRPLLVADSCGAPAAVPCATDTHAIDAEHAEVTRAQMRRS